MKNPSLLLRRAAATGAAAAAVLVLSGCATRAPIDHTALIKARPASILVLPPVNQTVDVQASPSVFAQTSRPLAESGYYVMPVALVDETFRQNGLTQPDDIHAVPLKKLREIFGADAVLYMTIKRYGTSYLVVTSESVVEAHAKLVDARSGDTLWEGSASASSNEGRNQGGSGIAGVLLSAVIQQVIGTTTNQSHQLAGVANQRLLSHTSHGGLAPGPRRPATKP